ncbi:MAG: 3-isopropylmalate dehydratase large subunit [bacterium]|nr:3-isopropylmalate dehydratase large subunit [bacterium]
MGMTLTEKIISAHTNKDEVHSGEFVIAKVDFSLANDITGPLAIKEFEKIGVNKVFDKDRIALIPDHFTPNKDIPSAEQCKILREFARKMDLKYYYEVGRVGIEHALLPEEGLVVPGDVVIGADSHTCTYGALGAFSTGVGSTDLANVWATGDIWLRVPESIKFILYGKPRKWVTGKDIILNIIGRIGVEGANYMAMEFSGEALKYISMDSRFTICNMAIEAGAKNGIIPFDDITANYIKGRNKRPYKIYLPDEDADYREVIEIDVSSIPLEVALPHLPSNVKSVEEVSDIYIDQVVIGSCTNGRMEDLRIAAQILKGKKVHPYVRLIIIPATQEIYLQALKEGLIEIFISAGASVSTPTCGPCLGGHMGILAKGERALATTNRNFIGRMGHPESEVYLCGPAVAAASSIEGKIIAPED